MGYGGRPLEYKEEFCDRVIELGREGKSHAQIARDLDFSRETLYAWAKTYPKFSDAINRAKDLAQAWFEDKGQAGLDTREFNAALWAKQVSCRFRADYTDKTESDVKTTHTVEIVRYGEDKTS